MTLEALAQPLLALWWDEGVCSDPMGAMTNGKPQLSSQQAAQTPLFISVGKGLGKPCLLFLPSHITAKADSD